MNAKAFVDVAGCRLALVNDAEQHAAFIHSASAFSLPALIAAQVQNSPEAVALECADASLSYHQLDETANRLAHMLVHYGVGRGDVVAVLLSPQSQAAIAILAVLKTGAACLSIDPAFPATRITAIFDDVTPAVALTTADLLPRLTGYGMTTIDVGDPLIEISYPSYALPLPPLSAWSYRQVRSPNCPTGTTEPPRRRR